MSSEHDDPERFQLPEWARESIPDVDALLEKVSLSMANQFLECGMDSKEACSLAATLLVRSAWRIAATGVIQSGGRPDPTRFIRTAEDVTEKFRFIEPENTSEIDTQATEKVGG